MDFLSCLEENRKNGLNKCTEEELIEEAKRVEDKTKKQNLISKIYDYWNFCIYPIVAISISNFIEIKESENKPAVPMIVLIVIQSLLLYAFMFKYIGEEDDYHQKVKQFLRQSVRVKTFIPDRQSILPFLHRVKNDKNEERLYEDVYGSSKDEPDTFLIKPLLSKEEHDSHYERYEVFINYLTEDKAEQVKKYYDYRYNDYIDEKNFMYQGFLSAIISVIIILLIPSQCKSDTFWYYLTSILILTHSLMKIYFGLKISNGKEIRKAQEIYFPFLYRLQTGKYILIYEIDGEIKTDENKYTLEEAINIQKNINKFTG